MEKNFDINQQGYSIRCKLLINDNDKQTRTFDNVVIVTHGFGSHKDTAGTVHFAEHLTSKYKNYAVIAFDWPCHGADARKKLSIPECMTYLTLVVDYARTELQAQNIYNYSTSFGAYITLRYLIEQGNPFKKIALRSPGVNMYESMSNHVSDEGFAKLKIDQAFMDDLKSFNVRDHEYFDFADDILILHGTKDEMIPIDLVRDFAENNVIEFVPVEGANHPFQNPNHMALAIHQIIEFFHKGD